MPESARARFEEAYFRDDSLLDRIETEEDGLVSDYVLGRLPDTERRLFEDSLLDTPYYRERVETTRSIRLRLAEERFFKKKAAAAGAGAAPSEGHDARLFPKGTGLAVGIGLLVLVAAASLASAFFLKSALSRARKELSERTPAPAPAAAAGVVPLAQTVVLAPPSSPGPAIVRLRRPAGGATLVVVPRGAIPVQAETVSLALLTGEAAAWDSGELPARGPDDGDFTLRLPPGVPAAGAYAVRLRTRNPAGAAVDSILGTLEIAER